MVIYINIWILAAIIICSMLAGFGYGLLGRRNRVHRDKDGSDEEAENPERMHKGKRISLGWAIGSPINGLVSSFQEGNRQGIVITPAQGKLFSPAAGKIVKLFPTGNAFMLRTEYGIELLLKAGHNTEELEGMHFRPRVIQNEVVNKGKLLLEFDMERIQAEGYDTAVRLSVESGDDYRDIIITDVERVKVGEELLWIRK